MLPSAVHLDLRDLQSARVWRWLNALGIEQRIEIRPFCNDVADPWECPAPPFSLELLMLLEQARDHGTAAMAAVVDGAFARLGASIESAHEELAAWLAIGAEAGLPLGEYDQEMERLQAEVGLWMAEAREEHQVMRSPTLLLDDVAVYVQLDTEVTSRAEARDLLEKVVVRVAGVASDPAGR